ncbi:hypothetical protein DL546_000037 [Coniochaeta pulveracea]|uniref:DUF7907 domain-containing protein n=1 Tax=Coniochaeta pulveracea TaxID=177199 RepID=A0A420Y1S5_9PEZI|nr:hypothetical protein DL546_000037 [Coniochaeta pulveracea]
MKFSTTTTLLGAALAGSASAQNYTQSAPFTLRVVSSDPASNITDSYLYACHAGAAIEGLCVGSNSTTPTVSNTYYFNTTTCDGCTPTNLGSLVWNLPVQLPDADHYSEALSISLDNLGSNVHFPLFEGGYGSTQLGFTDDKKLFASVYGDDSKNVPGERPESVTEELQNWYVCWGTVGGYYYQALAWVTAGEPHNPTCEKVEVVRDDI